MKKYFTTSNFFTLLFFLPIINFGHLLVTKGLIPQNPVWINHYLGFFFYSIAIFIMHQMVKSKERTINDQRETIIALGELIVKLADENANLKAELKPKKAPSKKQPAP